MNVFNRQLSLSELNLITQHLATLVDARIPLPQILDLLYLQTQKKILRRMFFNVKCRIEQGMTVSEAFRGHYPSLPDFALVMIEVGETSGRLDMIFRDLADYSTHMLKFRRLLIQASIYPLLLIVVSIITLGFLLLHVIPSFIGTFGELSENLPFITRYLLSAAMFIKEFSIFIFLFFLLLICTAILLYQSSKIRKYLNHFILRMPLIGPFILKINLIYTLHNFAILLYSGIDLQHALQIMQRTAPNELFKNEFGQVAEYSREGYSLYECFSRSTIFPVFVKGMIQVGEESAQLPEMLQKISRHLYSDLENLINNLSHLFEPVLIIVLGIIVGGVLIAIYIPLFQMVSHVPF